MLESNCGCFAGLVPGWAALITLKQEERVNEQLLFEVICVTRLLDMDMKLISAAQKEATLLERLDIARKHCKEAILLANEL